MVTVCARVIGFSAVRVRLSRVRGRS